MSVHSAVPLHVISGARNLKLLARCCEKVDRMFPHTTDEEVVCKHRVHFHHSMIWRMDSIPSSQLISSAHCSMRYSTPEETPCGNPPTPGGFPRGNPAANVSATAVHSDFIQPRARSQDASTRTQPKDFSQAWFAVSSFSGIAWRGGVDRVSSLIYDKVRKALKNFLETIVKDAYVYCESGNQFTVTLVKVIYALKRQGRTLRGVS